MLFSGSSCWHRVAPAKRVVTTPDVPAAAAPPRIASLVPSLTELLFALGLGAFVVARTGYCIHPIDGAHRVPKVGGTKDVNLAKLRRLAPTHVLLNIDENRHELADALAAWGADAPRLVVTHPCRVEDNLALLTQLGTEFGHLPGVLQRCAALQHDLAAALAAGPAVGASKQRVLYLIWRDPWMTVARDTYIASMLKRVGWFTLPDVAGGERGAARYPVVAGNEPWLRDVQRVLLSSEPYAFGAADATAAHALCPQARVQAVNGELLSWYGVRAIEGLRYLRQLAAA